MQSVADEPQIPFPDLVRNLYVDNRLLNSWCVTTTAALLAREKSRGQHVEIPMVDACMYFFCLME